MKKLFAALCFAAALLFSGAPVALAAENTITVQEIVATGITPSYEAANADGSKFRVGSDERTFMQLKNTNGSTRAVTLVAQTTSAIVPGVGAVTIANRSVTIPITSGDKMIGPIPAAFIDGDGFAHVTFDAVSNLTIAVIHIARASN